jgi:hypothetical protein
MAEGYLDPSARFELLPWSWAEERLHEARNYWVATTTAGGRVHVRPVWGVWLDGAVWFSSGSRIATHLERDPRASITLDDGDRALILEGDVELVSDHEALARFADAYSPKYDSPMDPSAIDAIFALRPTVAFAWIVRGAEGEASAFGRTATRFTFER